MAKRARVPAQARISFGHLDARHLYEYLLTYWKTLHAEGWPDKRPCGGCYQCEQISARLECMIGAKAVRELKRTVFGGNQLLQKQRRNR